MKTAEEWDATVICPCGGGSCATCQSGSRVALYRRIQADIVRTILAQRWVINTPREAHPFYREGYTNGVDDSTRFIMAALKSMISFTEPEVDP